MNRLWDFSKKFFPSRRSSTSSSISSMSDDNDDSRRAHVKKWESMKALMSRLQKLKVDEESFDPDRFAELMDKIDDFEQDDRRIMLNVKVNQDEELTLLHACIVAGNLTAFRRLISSGADIERVNKLRCTPLCIAVNIGRRAMVHDLLAAGANINARQPLGRTVLHHACFRSAFDLVSILVRAGVDIQAGDRDCRTAVHLAVTANLPLMIPFLAHRGANIEAKDKDDVTPLHLAASVGNVECMEMLLKLGANPKLEDRLGRHPIHCAAIGCNPEAIRILVRHGCDVNALSKNLATPLHFAMFVENVETIRMLLSLNAKTDLEDKEGRTAGARCFVSTRLQTRYNHACLLHFLAINRRLQLAALDPTSAGNYAASDGLDWVVLDNLRHCMEKMPAWPIRPTPLIDVVREHEPQQVEIAEE